MDKIVRMKKWPIKLAMMKVPILDWLPHYTKEMFSKDLLAGLTVFVFLVPQSMAYALLAGMPTVYGLYSSTVPLYFYAMLGTSRQLSIGPMAITSLLLGVSCQKFGYDDGSPKYIQIAMNVSMLVGLATFLLGTFRLGTLSNLISHSVLVGFLTASALVIAVSQLKYILGIHMPRFNYSHQTIYYLLSHLPDSKGPALALGLITWGALLGVREWKKHYTAPIATDSSWKARVNRILFTMSNLSNFLAILLGALAARLIIEAGGDVQIVGTIPSAFAIAFVAFAGNWAVAKRYALKNNYEVDATQELLGEGFTIIVGVLFNSFVVSGGLARSAVNAESGAVTQISGCITATLILIALIALTSFLYYIPMAVLAAVIEASIISMFDFSSMVAAYHTDRRDCLVMVATFLFTFFLGVTEGLFAGMFISIGVVMQASAFPGIAHLGKFQRGDEHYYKDVKRFPEAEQVPGVAIVRMDASPYFANTAHFKAVIMLAAKGEYHSSPDPIHLVIIDASAWIDIDLSGVQTLFDLKSEVAHCFEGKVELCIACAKGRIRDRLRACHFIHELDEGMLYFSIDDAIAGRAPSRSFAVSQQELITISSKKQSDYSSIRTEEQVISPGDDHDFDTENPLHF
eukprot:gene11715-13151_t